MNRFDYTDKDVFMGIDVHKKTYVCVNICEGKVVKKDTMPAKPEQLIAYINNHFAGANLRTAYEAGFACNHLHRILVEAGIDSCVIHPGSLEVSSRNKIKTDKRDARKIAEHLADNRISGIHIPEESFEYERSLSRTRRKLVNLQLKVGNMLKGLLFTQGLIPLEDDRVLSKSWLQEKLKEVIDKAYPDSFVDSLTNYAQSWFSLREQIKKLEKQLDYQAQKHPELTIYRSVPGIGRIHSIELFYELGDMSQFKSEKRLYSYTGLTPSEYSSGEHIRQGHISGQGRGSIRRILVEAAWTAIKYDNSLLEIFNRIAKHRGKKRAIVGVARRLVGRLRCCLKHRVLYEAQVITS